jgi:ATP-binding cassette subfamily B protein
VLSGFTLRIERGQRVGLVGPSGAGKSTVISLVQRLFDIDGGRLLIDGQDVRTMTQDSLRTAIAVVPQEVSLFHRSVIENIRYARPEASDEAVFAAAKAAAATILFTLFRKATQRSSANAARSSPEDSGNAWASLGRC